jgi:hypothetical protein
VQAGRVEDGQITGEVGLVPENYLQLLDLHEGLLEVDGDDRSSHEDGCTEAGMEGRNETGTPAGPPFDNRDDKASTDSMGIKLPATVDQLEENVIVEEEEAR